MEKKRKADKSWETTRMQQGENIVLKEVVQGWLEVGSKSGFRAHGWIRGW